MDLDVDIHILRLDGHEQRSEPFKRPEVFTDPEKVYLSKPCFLLGVVHAVPDALENRGEWCNSNSSTHEDSDLVLEDIFGSTPKRSIDIDSRQDPPDGWVDIRLTRATTIDANHGRVVLLTVSVEVAPNSRGQGLCEVSDATNMDRKVILLWCTSKGERMELENRHLRTAEEDVL